MSPANDLGIRQVDEITITYVLMSTRDGIVHGSLNVLLTYLLSPSCEPLQQRARGQCYRMVWYQRDTGLSQWHALIFDGRPPLPSHRARFHPWPPEFKFEIPVQMHNNPPIDPVTGTPIIDLENL